MDHRRAADLLALALAGDAARLRTMLGPAGEPALDGEPDRPGGVTPLMAAASGGHEAAVELELLLRSGADPARRDARGRSAAAYARAAGHPHLAERLDTVVDQERTIR